MYQLLAVFAKPIALLLNLLYNIVDKLDPPSIIGSYGIAIVLLTLIVRGILFPLYSAQMKQSIKALLGITVLDHLENDLARAQSNWTKAFNALSQTLISEVGIGTVKAFSDIADGVVNGIGSAFFNSKNNYTNPVSQVLEEWKETFDNEVAPIYLQDNVNIFNGGFGNFGWWMKNIPRMVSKSL